ncbi:hypothetical protein JI664_03570 [Rhodobacter sp. NTK016B]|uniref:phage head-tail joining protein n=1 Tax=Rhodobacter sp. NTK016B TaxID=2759676 RepID=UPI001A90457A|nr:hypothetical protein [Rhodobacter sp. NTK016B]MBN8291036.1 hypothetical protein [Rhodobacter sp. NTK016B]
MSWTQDDLTAIEAAIAKGVSSVRIGDEQYTFRSLSEMRQTRDMIRDGLAGAGGRSRQVYPRLVRRPV